MNEVSSAQPELASRRLPVKKPWLTAAVLAVVAAAGLATVWHSRDASLVADDYYFVLSPAAHDVASSISAGWGHPIGRTVGYRPLATASYALNAALAEQNARAFRVANFVLHAVASVLVAYLAVLLTGSRLSALGSGTLFAVHPAHHESVVWISGRPYVIATAFLLGAAVLLVRAAVGHGGRVRAAWCAGACALAALSSYEASVVGPLFLLGALVCAGSRGRDRWLLLLPSAIATLVYVGWRVAFLTTVDRDAAHMIQADLPTALSNLGHMGDRLLACGGCVRFRSPLSSETFLVGLAASAAASVSLWLGGRRTMVVGIGVMVASSLLPFVGAPAFTDRFLYLATVGPCLLLGAPIAWLAGARRLVTLAIVSILCALWGRQLALLSTDWLRAGAMADRALASLGPHLRCASSSTELHVLDLPVYQGEALVFPTYFFLAAQRYYRNPLLVVREYRAGSNPDTVSRILAGAGADDVVLRWDEPTNDWKTLLSGPPCRPGQLTVP